MWKLKYKKEDYSLFGLNKQRNFLKGGAEIKVNDDDELFEIMGALLENHACLKSAIFAISRIGVMYAAVMYARDEDFDDITDLSSIYEDDDDDEDEDSVEVVVDILATEFTIDWFAELDADFRLCCYSIIEEVENGIWKVLEC